MRETLPKTVEEVQQLREDQNRLAEKLALTEEHLRKQEAESERRLQEQLAKQQEHFERQLRAMVDDRFATALRNINTTPIAAEQEVGKTMIVDDIVTNETSAAPFAGLEGTGLSLAEFGSAALNVGGDSISSASTVRHVGTTLPSISFTFGSGIALPEPSVSTINSNLPFADTPPGPTFHHADLSVTAPSPLPAPSPTTHPLQSSSNAQDEENGEKRSEEEENRT